MPLSTIEIFLDILAFGAYQSEDNYLFLILTNLNLGYILQ